MPDDHSESVPPLPIPNRTVKRLHADDSADSRVKVGNRQAPLQQQKPHPKKVGFLRLRRQGTARQSRPGKQIRESRPGTGLRLLPCHHGGHAASTPGPCAARQPVRRPRLDRKIPAGAHPACYAPVPPALTPSRSAARSRNPSVPDTRAQRPPLHGSPAPHLPNTPRRSIDGNRAPGRPSADRGATSTHRS